jgi:hypothetical protein
MDCFQWKVSSCAHLCPPFGEVALQCQDFTFINGYDGDGKRGQSLEIMMCIPFT